MLRHSCHFLLDRSQGGKDHRSLLNQLLLIGQLEAAYNFPNLRSLKDIHRKRDPFRNLDGIKVEIAGPGFCPSISQVLDDPRIGKSVMVDIVLKVLDLLEAK